MSRYARPTSLSYLGPGPMTPAVKWIIWANVAVFVARIIYPRLAEFLGLIPEAVIEHRWIWQPVTYMFVHEGFTHILFNMLGIWMFGVELERKWGTQFFLKYYAITGVGAALTTLIVSLLPFAVTAATYGSNTVGASGALYGILLAFALYYPERPILMFMLFPIPAKYFVMIIGAISFLSATGGAPSRRACGPSRRHGFRLLVSEGRRRRAQRRDQVPLREVEDEPAPPQVRRVFGRPVRLGPQGSLTAAAATQA